MDVRYCDKFRSVDEDSYLRDFIRAVEHKDLNYLSFILPIIKDQQASVNCGTDVAGHYLQIAEEDVSRYVKILSHALLLASHNGSIDIIELIIKHGVPVNFANQAGDTALIKACERGHGDVVRLLLDHGADVNQENLVGSTPLQWISRMTERSDIVDILLLHPDIDVNKASHKKGRTALHCAAECDPSGRICRSLLDMHALVNMCDSEGHTALHLAASHGLFSNVRLLIEYGAFINMPTEQLGMTALHLAMREGHSDVSKLLLTCGSDINILDKLGHSAVDLLNRHAKFKAPQGFTQIAAHIQHDLEAVVTQQQQVLDKTFLELCELIEEDKWYLLFKQLFHGQSSLEDNINSVCERTSESSLSVLLLHLLRLWYKKCTPQATFWILMRALRDHSMTSVADRMVRIYWIR